ncbi:hypothetical protein [Bacillus ndiopicus]|uniref:hypothetical protein n=1 Tax=Bacillus ndiopicus TaxID=1347368 RepID=UPI0005A6E25A|nr:hypothetical protein [Bacillus ndiopicus]
MQAFLHTYQWILFIGAEIISIGASLLFGITRYFFNKRTISKGFILLFILATVFEAAIAWIIYDYTGEISSFTILTTLFVVYTIIFGLNDFRKLDRWMRMKIGNYRGINLLTPKEYQIIKSERNSHYKKRRNITMTTIHVLFFIIAQILFWMMGTESLSQFGYYFSTIGEWLTSGQFENSPYPSEFLYQISMVWVIVVVVDILYCSSYLLKKS